MVFTFVLALGTFDFFAWQLVGKDRMRLRRLAGRTKLRPTSCLVQMFPRTSRVWCSKCARVGCLARRVQHMAAYWFARLFVRSVAR